jgi:hypothetical protein
MIKIQTPSCGGGSAWNATIPQGDSLSVSQAQTGTDGETAMDEPVTGTKIADPSTLEWIWGPDGPNHWMVPWEPDFDDVVTTLAIGEEGGPDPFEYFPPCEPAIGWETTMAIGEEGPPLDMDVLLG